jgi:uncharacterized damage-inducible protein DinB
MKHFTFAGSAVALLFVVGFAFAQGVQMQGQKIGLATSLQRGYATFKTNFTQAAEKMPEADYTFKPGSTPEARTYAAVIAHIAQSQFAQCSGMKGVPNPMQGKQLEQELKTKAEVTKALADSFALCDDLFDQVTDANATEMIKQGMNEVTRAAGLYGVIVHGNEMAGTAYVYLRSKNIVPPSTENASRGRRGRG